MATAPANRHWSIAAHLLCLALSACVLSTSFSVMAPQAMRESLWANSLLGLALLAVLGIGAFWFSSRLKLPLRDLAMAAGDVIRGHLEVRVPTRRCPRELSKLTAEFNEMLARLQQTQAELQATKAQLEERVTARTAELAVSNKELEAFAYSVSHDLRAPVRLVRSFADLLEGEASRLSPAGREKLHSIRNEARHMNEMIDALMDMSRLARAPLVVTTVNLSSLVEDIACSLRQTAPERQVSFVIAPNLQAFGDRRLLRMVLQNLVGNAWKFTCRQLKPRIEFSSTERNGERVFFVRDNGAGFDLSAATGLFTPFQRFHTADEFEGVGVGLATVRRIVERHGGQIWAESEPGRGATFYFTLPECTMAQSVGPV